MATSERASLRLHEAATELHLDPRKFSLLALRVILQYQIYSEIPAQITLETMGKRFKLSPEAIKGARKLHDEKRKSFLDVTSKAMLDADKIIILRKPIARKPEVPLEQRYMDVFKDFINSNPQINLGK